MISRLVERELPAAPAAGAGLEGARAVDLYSGVGVFAHFLARSHAQLVCVESDARTLEYARSNTPPGTAFSASGVDAWTAGAAARQRYDTVLADPPRTGLGPVVTTWLARADAQTFIYISCDPATLARDSQALLASGWHLESLRLYDFYPHTGHIESAARFVRNPVQDRASN
jgi:23S rRNA (uracil1939-C5)-methyltransferase